MLGNLAMRECMCWAKPAYDKSLSDHCPLQGEFSCKAISHNVWHCPTPLRIGEVQLAQFEWVGQPTSYTEWTCIAQRWLAKTYQVAPVNRVSLHSTPYKKPNSLRRTLHALGLDAVNLTQALKDIRTCLTRYLDAKKREALCSWKKKVLTWSVSAKQLFTYIQNPLPCKTFALRAEGCVTNHPGKMFRLLNDYWGGIEMWPSSAAFDLAWEATEDLFGIYLPVFQSSFRLTGIKLKRAAQKMKKSAPGPDGWSVAEIKALPLCAWNQLAALYNSPAWNPRTTLLSAFRRIPIEKSTQWELPEAANIRPIDIFSTITRVISSAATTELEDWRKHVIHKSQHATHGGALEASARILFVSESILRRRPGTLWGLSPDFSKLYNMISPVIAAKFATMMGLEGVSAQKLIEPILTSSGFWRLPNNAVCPPIRLGRGLPQGLSTSVLLAETFVSGLIWKLHWGEQR